MRFPLNLDFLFLSLTVTTQKPNTCSPWTPCSICHWNLNSISVHSYAKMFLLKACIAIHKFDIVCISEMYLDSNASPDDNNLKISRYNLIRSDHPLNNKRGGSCIYCKHFLPLRILDVQYLPECINFEMKIGNKICHFISFYRSPR